MESPLDALARANADVPTEHLEQVAGGVTALDIAVIVILILMFP